MKFEIGKTYIFRNLRTEESNDFQKGDDYVYETLVWTGGTWTITIENEEALEAENKCKIFRFVVTTPQNEFIQAKRFADDCPTNTAYGNVEANSVIEQIEAVPLDASRYAPGDYKLRVKFWDYEGEAEFTLVAAN